MACATGCRKDGATGRITVGYRSIWKVARRLRKYELYEQEKVHNERIVNASIHCCGFEIENFIHSIAGKWEPSWYIIFQSRELSEAGSMTPFQACFKIALWVCHTYQEGVPTLS